MGVCVCAGILGVLGGEGRRAAGVEVPHDQARIQLRQSQQAALGRAAENDLLRAEPGQ